MFKGSLRQLCLCLKGCFAQREVIAWRNLPANYHSLDTSQEALRKDAEYAYQVGQGYLSAIRREGIALDGLRAVEFGPGANFGAALYFVCHGARMTLADRFLSPWKKNYHPLFYREFLRFLTEKEPGLCLDPIRRVLESTGYPEGILVLHHCSLEDMRALPAAMFDVTLSNAVFEHLYDVNLAFAQLSRLTVNGGMGFHQVDHRDHRDFSRPLEYLIPSDREFLEIFNRCHGECGNRMRPRQMEEAFNRNGFEVVRREENMSVCADYLENFFSRLQGVQSTAFAKLPKEEFKCLSCRYVIRKTGVSSRSYESDLCGWKGGEL